MQLHSKLWMKTLWLTGGAPSHTADQKCVKVILERLFSTLRLQFLLNKHHETFSNFNINLLSCPTDDLEGFFTRKHKFQLSSNGDGWPPGK